MSNANNGIKVLKTALKRVDKGWSNSTWVDAKDDGKGGKIYTVCLEGAIYGYCSLNTIKQRKMEPTAAQLEAMAACKSAIFDRYGDKYGPTEDKVTIPSFNDDKDRQDGDKDRQKDEVKEIIKLAIIKLETGWPDNCADPEGDDVDENTLGFLDLVKTS